MGNDTARPRYREHSGTSTPERAIFTATEKLLHSAPLHEISVEHMLKEAKISRSAFYYYFSSKYDVIASLAAAVLDDILHGLDTWTGTHTDPDPDVLRIGLESGIAMWNEHGPLLAAAIENLNESVELRDTWLRFVDTITIAIAAEIERERSAGSAPAGLPAETVAGTLVWGSERLLYLGLRELDPAVPTLEAAGAALTELWSTAIYGTGHGG
jgi:AcrR family transcriptional regulator